MPIIGTSSRSIEYTKSEIEHYQAVLKAAEEKFSHSTDRRTTSRLHMVERLSKFLRQNYWKFSVANVLVTSGIGLLVVSLLPKHNDDSALLFGIFALAMSISGFTFTLIANYELRKDQRHIRRIKTFEQEAVLAAKRG